MAGPQSAGQLVSVSPHRGLQKPSPHLPHRSSVDMTSCSTPEGWPPQSCGQLVSVSPHRGLQKLSPHLPHNKSRAPSWFAARGWPAVLQYSEAGDAAGGAVSDPAVFTAIIAIRPIPMHIMIRFRIILPHLNISLGDYMRELASARLKWCAPVELDRRSGRVAEGTCDPVSA